MHVCCSMLLLCGFLHFMCNRYISLAVSFRMCVHWWWCMCYLLFIAYALRTYLFTISCTRRQTSITTSSSCFCFSLSLFSFLHPLCQEQMFSAAGTCSASCNTQPCAVCIRRERTLHAIAIATTMTIIICRVAVIHVPFLLSMKSYFTVTHHPVAAAACPTSVPL